MMQTLVAQVSNEIKIQRSRFIACLYPCDSPEAARKLLNEHTRLFSDATHNCYAWVCGINGENTYYSDAGEPGGTAGKPILNALLRADVTNCLAVVTRYYGGIKLGVKGLIEAYGSAVESALQKAELVVARELLSYSVTCDYACFDSLKHKVTELEGTISEVQYSKEVSLMIAIPVQNKAAIQEIFDGYRTQSRLDYNLV